MGISDKHIEMKNAQADMEIENSPALQRICLNFSSLRKQIEQLEKRVTKLDEMKECGQCGAEVPRNEWHVVYKDPEKGVCEPCWQRHYVPYMNDPARPL